MKLLKYKTGSIMLILTILFSGCSDYKSIQECKDMKFSGIVLILENSEQNILCSNGKTVKTQDGLQVVVNYGLHPVAFYVGKPHYRDFHLVYINFEKGFKDFEELK